MSRTRLSRTLRLAVAAAALGASVSLAGCGFDAQTLQSYTPAQGVNVDVNGIKVRNLLVVADASGQGRLSASIVSPKTDALTGVAGVTTKQDGTPGGSLAVSGATNLPLPANKLVVLTDDGTNVAVRGAGLKPGFTVTLQLSFASGGRTELRVPVMDAANPVYSSVGPTAAPGA